MFDPAKNKQGFQMSESLVLIESGWRDYSMISRGWPQSQSPSPLRGSSGFFYSCSLKLRLDSPHKKSPTLRVGLFFGRDGEIRTHDPLHPMHNSRCFLFLYLLLYI